MKIIISLLIICTLLIIGCSNEKESEPMPEIKDTFIAQEPTDVILRTNDDLQISAKYYPNSNSDKGLILVHQFTLDKTSYDKFVSTFQRTHNVLAIDLRGHGKSSLDYKDFSDEDFQKMALDLKTAQEYLIRQNVDESKISYIGASIGANTVHNFVLKNKHEHSVLLSPGSLYKGIRLEMKDSSSLVIVSKEDTYSFESVKELEEISPNSEFIYLENNKHGTNMLDEELVNKIVEYLK